MARLHRGDPADSPRRRPHRLGVARVGPPDPGSRPRAGPSRRSGPESRPLRHQRLGEAPEMDPRGARAAEGPGVRGRRTPSPRSSSPISSTSTPSPTTPASIRSRSASPRRARSGSSTTARRPRRRRARPEGARVAAGDLLYRWGNPQLYGRGDSTAQQLFYQHAVHWIPDGMRGAGNLLLLQQRSRAFRRELVVGRRVRAARRRRRPLRAPRGCLLGPARARLTYANRETFFAPFISGAHRLGNGHTMICSGPNGRFFEVDPKVRSSGSTGTPTRATSG